MADDPVRQAFEYEDNLDDALLSAAGLLRLTALVPVHPGLRAVVREGLDTLRQGRRVGPLPSGALQEVFAAALDAFQEDMRKRADARAKAAGIKVAMPFKLTKMERETLSAFLLWLVTKKIVEFREGRLPDAYQAAFEEMNGG